MSENNEEKHEETHEESHNDSHEEKSIAELSNAIDEIMARLSVIEQSSTQKPKDDDDKPKNDEKPKDDDNEPQVESADEIEKLLNC